MVGVDTVRLVSFACLAGLLWVGSTAALTDAGPTTPVDWLVMFGAGAVLLGVLAFVGTWVFEGRDASRRVERD